MGGSKDGGHGRVDGLERKHKGECLRLTNGCRGHDGTQ